MMTLSSVVTGVFGIDDVRGRDAFSSRVGCALSDKGFHLHGALTLMFDDASGSLVVEQPIVKEAKEGCGGFICVEDVLDLAPDDGVVVGKGGVREKDFMMYHLFVGQDDPEFHAVVDEAVNGMLQWRLYQGLVSASMGEGTVVAQAVTRIAHMKSYPDFGL